MHGSEINETTGAYATDYDQMQDTDLAVVSSPEVVPVQMNESGAQTNTGCNKFSDYETGVDTVPSILSVGSNKSVAFENLPTSHKSQGDPDIFEKDPLDHADAISVVSSVLTADGIADPVSFNVNCFIVFLGDVARGIFFPTMWNLVQTLGGDQVLLGYLIASFSFGRMLVLPLFGTWSIKYGYKWTLRFSTMVLLIGSILFAQVLNVRKQWFALLANVIVGIGSGTLGVTFAYASDVTPKRKRTSYLSWVSAIQYAGTTATPFIGSFFVVLFSNEDRDNYRG